MIMPGESSFKKSQRWIGFGGSFPTLPHAGRPELRLSDVVVVLAGFRMISTFLTRLWMHFTSGLYALI